MGFIEKYKSGLALLLGTTCLIVGLYAPAMSALLLLEHPCDTATWKTSNFLFIGLGIIFMWGEIVALATTFQNVIKKKTE